MRTANNSNKSGFFIGITCPGCGGNLEIESDFFVLTCDHCGSNLRIKMPEIPPAYLIKSGRQKREIRFHLDRWLKSKSMPLSGSDLDLTPFYYPYWKIDAVLLKVRNEVIERQSVDEYNYENVRTYEQKMTDIRLTPLTVSQAAGPAMDFIPHSIGIRSQYSKIFPYTRPNMEAGFAGIPVVKSWKAARKDLNGSVSAVGSIARAQFGKNRTDMFHPTGSIIYFPYFLVGCNCRGDKYQFLSDGVTGKVLKQLDKKVDPEIINSTGTDNMEFGRLEVESHRCSNCGTDLPGRQSHVYICDNCGVTTALGRTSQTIDTVLKAGSSADSKERMFPFWVFKLNETDAKKLRRFFGGIYDSDSLVIPAFKVPNFEAMYRLAKRISTALPKLELTRLDKQGKRFADVNLDAEEALTMAEIIIYREYISQTKIPAEFDSDIKPAGISLFYAPFRKENYFYVDTTLGAVTFEKSLAG